MKRLTSCEVDASTDALRDVALSSDPVPEGFLTAPHIDMSAQ
jgi:hypothetical protein